jgi:hypothetical protein
MDTHSVRVFITRVSRQESDRGGELMPTTFIHRLYTEDKNKRQILRVAAAHFESFTVQPTEGYYRGRREQSIVLEINGAHPRKVEELAREIRRMNGQKSVLILRTRATAKATRR